jgi:hypothetical protein
MTTFVKYVLYMSYTTKTLMPSELFIAIIENLDINSPLEQGYSPNSQSTVLENAISYKLTEYVAILFQRGAKLTKNLENSAIFREPNETFDLVVQQLPNASTEIICGCLQAALDESNEHCARKIMDVIPADLIVTTLQNFYSQPKGIKAVLDYIAVEIVVERVCKYEYWSYSKDPVAGLSAIFDKISDDETMTVFLTKIFTPQLVEEVANRYA